MIRRFTAKNFRCLENLELDHLARVNIVLGKNNTGKTSLLDALVLHIGPHNPILSINVNAFRGVTPGLIGSTDQAWRWLFFGSDIARTIELSSESFDSRRRSLTMNFEPIAKAKIRGTSDAEGVASPASLDALDPSRGMISTNTIGQGLHCRYSEADVPVFETTIAVDADDNLNVHAPTNFPVPIGIYLSSKNRTMRDMTERFSRLVESGRDVDVTKALQEIEPRLRRIELLAPAGHANLYADLGFGKKISFQLLGDGTSSLLNILLAITQAAGGFVFIDEVENGIHYSAHQSLWSAIMRMAREFDVQVVATSHSLECTLSAMHAAERSAPYDFMVHHLRMIDGSIRTVCYDQEALHGAEIHDAEIR